MRSKLATFGVRTLTMRGRLVFSNFTEKLADTNLPKFGNSRSLDSKDANTSFERNVCLSLYPTIGYGHVVKNDEDFSAGIDEAQAEELLRQDAQIAERAVLRLINVPLTDGQFDALVSFTYNLGGWS